MVDGSVSKGICSVVDVSSASVVEISLSTFKSFLLLLSCVCIVSDALIIRESIASVISSVSIVEIDFLAVTWVSPLNPNTDKMLFEKLFCNLTCFDSNSSTEITDDIARRRNTAVVVLFSFILDLNDNRSCYLSK